MDHPHPTRQNNKVNAWATPTIQLMTNDPILTLAPSCCENLGIPRHKQNRPDKIVPFWMKRVFELKNDVLTKKLIFIMKTLPDPGMKQLQSKQNHAKQTGNTGIAPFIKDACSMRDSSNFGRLSSGGSVGAILCFLLFILVRLLSDGSLRLQPKSFEQHPL